MGGGGTIADGLRCLFQQRSTTTTKRRNDDDADADADHDNRVSVKDLRSQLATIPTTNNDRHHHTPLPPTTTTKSSLFNIKVPVQPLFPPSSMDPNKKIADDSDEDIEVIINIEDIPQNDNDSHINLYNNMVDLFLGGKAVLKQFGAGDMEVQIIWLLMRQSFSNFRNLRSFTFRHVREVTCSSPPIL